MKALTERSLLEFGFKEYPVSKHLHDEHEKQYCYMVKDEIGKKFQIVVRFWQHSKYSTPDHLILDGWDARCQFNTYNDDTFDVIKSVAHQSPQEIVDWFENVHEKLEAAYYKLWRT